MKNKTKRKLIKLLNMVMIIFLFINIINTILANSVYADGAVETITDTAANGTGYLAAALAAMGMGGILTTVVGLPLLMINILKLIIIVVGLILQALLSGAYSSLESVPNWAGLKDIVFAGADECSQFLDVNFFNFEIGEGALLIFRQSIAKWYYILRLISSVVLLVILIYVGIKMALSTIASDQAKYKQMLVDWVTSLALLFFLHYIIIFIITVNSAFVTSLSSVHDSSSDMIEQLQEEMWNVGFEGVFAAVIYVIYVGQVFSFFLLYLKRMITVGFLIMISPLITITYAIDKMGDGKAQALNNWLKELIYNILIQPFHCVLFIAFFDTIAGMLDGDGNPFGIGEYIFAIMIMTFMKKAEDILKKIFHFEASSMSSISESGQNIMNATGKFAKIGMAAGSALSSFNAAGGMKALKQGLQTKRDNRMATAQLKKEFKSTKNLKDSYSSFSEYKNSEKGQERLTQIKKSNATEMAKKAEQNRAKRNERKDQKIKNKAEQQLRQEMGDHGYEQLKRKAEGGDKNAQKIISDKENKIREGSFPKRAIKGVSKATAGLGDGFKRFAASDLGKLTGAAAKDSVKVAAAIGMGAFGLGATGELNDVISGGQLGYGFAKGFLENSKKTVTNDAADATEKLIDHTGANPAETGKIINNIIYQGNNGQYEGKILNEQIQKLLDDIAKAAGGGQKGDRAAQDFLNNLQYQATNPSETLDVDKLVESLNLADNDEKDDILREANNFAKTYIESIIFSQYGQAKSFNMDAEEFTTRVTNNVQKIYTVNNTYETHNETHNNTYNNQNGNNNP